MSTAGNRHAIAAAAARAALLLPSPARARPHPSQDISYIHNTHPRPRTRPLQPFFYAPPFESTHKHIRPAFIPRTRRFPLLLPYLRG
ncbi:hypothetical protein K456DRAFT_53410 [Colletotrichum gloeosporioides 23]|nr:hypothetical protein K456DRAFT_53410 [Colletotrichum gloeosporioides 23]